MNFNSLQYLLFLPAAILLYYLLPHRWRNPLLLVLSFYFYMCWVPRYALLMMFSILVTYFCARLLSAQALRQRKLWLAICLLLNLSVLFFFKYFNFAAELVGHLLTSAGLTVAAPRLDVLLPVGISFYTFQALGYTIDVYRGETPAERNFITYALFVSFFPQLVAGPIERSAHLLPQFHEKHSFCYANIKAGLLPVLWGLFKKMVIADPIAVLVNTVYAAPQDYSGWLLTVATACFAIQIYCDFSAYSDIARGSARMLGFRLMRNFDCPYFAVSIRDFWRRWHISLSTWFKDYLYIPLGGSRCSRLRTDLNLLIVFAISGLWHGASLTFLAWGILNGAYQIAGSHTLPLRNALRARLHIAESNPALQIFRYLFTFALVCFAWILFRAENISDALLIMHRVLDLPAYGTLLPRGLGSLGLTRPELLVIFAAILLLAVVDLRGKNCDIAAALDKHIACRYLVYFLLITAILLFGSYGPGYDPQEFVYFQF